MVETLEVYSAVQSMDTTLLLIDLQKAINDPSWGIINNPQAENNIELLLTYWRRNTMSDIHVRHVPAHRIQLTAMVKLV